MCEVPLSRYVKLKRQLQVLYSFIGRYADYTITNTPAPILEKVIHFPKLVSIPEVLWFHKMGQTIMRQKNKTCNQRDLKSITLKKLDLRALNMTEAYFLAVLLW